MNADFTSYRRFLLSLFCAAMLLPGPALAGPAASEDKICTDCGVSSGIALGKMKKIKEMRGGHIYSPKSVVFHPDGKTFYINALEGMETLAYDSKTLECKAIIRHVFTGADSALFGGEETLFDYAYNNGKGPGKRNIFGGKPVESAFSHGGKYLWVTYYRRDFDPNASSPSAVAIIDTQSNKIVRVMPTAPLPKMITASPDGKLMAVIHWGDNTAGLIDISSHDPAKFAYKKLLVSGTRMQLKGISGNRDQNCGQCLRGAAFSKDSRYLFIGKMHGGGIAVFDVQSGSCLGTFSNVPPTPRHIVLSPDGRTLYVTSSKSGTVTALDAAGVVENVRSRGKAACRSKSLFVGQRPRTVALSRDGKTLYVACNGDSKVVRVDIASWKVTGSESVPPYAVGAAVSPDLRLVVTTSQ
ncbi:MAG: beta-propeller fold lactonase family protein, partial [Mailhella sp.]|nr:beta-propeller fold lactonase family protein [Mailhella sp.]